MGVLLLLLAFALIAFCAWLARGPDKRTYEQWVDEQW